MPRFVRFALVALAGLALAACATTYGPARVGKVGGYSDTQLGPTSYEVRAAANGPADRFAPIMALYRAAELTLGHGYSHFLVTHADGNQTLVGYGSPTNFAGDEVLLTVEMEHDTTIPATYVGERPRLFQASEVIARLQPQIDARQ